MLLHFSLPLPTPVCADDSRDASPDAGAGGCDACDCGSAEAGCGDVGGDVTRGEEQDSLITLAPSRSSPFPTSCLCWSPHLISLPVTPSETKGALGEQVIGASSSSFMCWLIPPEPSTSAPPLLCLLLMLGSFCSSSSACSIVMSSSGANQTPQSPTEIAVIGLSKDTPAPEPPPKDAPQLAAVDASPPLEAANAEAAAAKCGEPGPLSDGVLRPTLLLALVLRGMPSSDRDADETPPDRSSRPECELLDTWSPTFCTPCELEHTRSDDYWASVLLAFVCARSVSALTHNPDKASRRVLTCADAVAPAAAPACMAGLAERARTLVCPRHCWLVTQLDSSVFALGKREGRRCAVMRLPGAPLAPRTTGRAGPALRVAHL